MDEKSFGALAMLIGRTAALYTSEAIGRVLGLGRFSPLRLLSVLPRIAGVKLRFA